MPHFRLSRNISLSFTKKTLNYIPTSCRCRGRHSNSMSRMPMHVFRVFFLSTHTNLNLCYKNNLWLNYAIYLYISCTNIQMTILYNICLCNMKYTSKTKTKKFKIIIWTGCVWKFKLGSQAEFSLLSRSFHYVYVSLGFRTTPTIPWPPPTSETAKLLNFAI